MVLTVHKKPPVSQSDTAKSTNKKRSGPATKPSTYEHDAVFDIGKERNKGNQFWKEGKGREEHRALEIAAKERRNNKTKTSQSKGIKVQILEEPDSDEVSPGVTRTHSPPISPKSSE